jgi:hypothetical protein
VESGFLIQRCDLDGLESILLETAHNIFFRQHRSAAPKSFINSSFLSHGSERCYWKNAGWLRRSRTATNPPYVW